MPADPMPRMTLTPAIVAARGKWRYRGETRPDFAEVPGPGQVSVWDFPRPPAVENSGRLLEVRHDGQIVASTRRGKRVIETAGAPTWYFPPEDVVAGCVASGRNTVCEWKGLAESLDVAGVGGAGWRYVRMFAEFDGLYLWVSFHPGKLHCFIDNEPVDPQPGGDYGGWVTPDLAGPIKGAPGSESW